LKLGYNPGLLIPRESAEAHQFNGEYVAGFSGEA
jgi:hypothetical protein